MQVTSLALLPRTLFVLGSVLCSTGCSPESAIMNPTTQSGAAGTSVKPGGAAGSASSGVAGNRVQTVAGMPATLPVVAGMSGKPPVVAGTTAPQIAGAVAPGPAGTLALPPPPAAGSSGAPPVAGMAGEAPGGMMPTMLPTPKGTCEDFRTGTMKFNGISVQIWAGKPATTAPGGPLLIYWHGTGTSSGEASQAFGQTGISDVVAKGGIVASFIDTTMKGSVSGGTIWYSEDLGVADQIVACAIEKQKIDVRRIHSSGYSAGGLQTGAMMAQRSNYIASALIYSGGVIALGANPNPSNVPPLMCAHGAVGSDTLGLDFAMSCQNLETETVKKGSFAVDCNDGGAHIDIFSRFAPAEFGYKFLMAHPFGTKPSPWKSMLPAGAPATCKIWMGN